MTVVTPDIRCYADVSALVEAAAHLLAKRIVRQLEETGECRLAFAGGNSPRPVYQRLAQADLRRTIAWKHVHVFWGDERCVPSDDEASNYRMAYSALLSHVPVIKSNVHRIEVERGSIAAARRYAEILGNEPLDLVLLGMGGDGHTASLFPDTPDLATSERVIPTRSPVPPVDRVSISLREINEAGEVHLLVSGAEKKKRLAEVLRQIEDGRPALPVARVQPRSGQLFWLTDAAAAQQLAMSHH